MQGVTLCALGDFAANPIIETIKNFPDDFKAHIARESAGTGGRRAEGCAGARRRLTTRSGSRCRRLDLARTTTNQDFEQDTVASSPSLWQRIRALVFAAWSAGIT